MFSRAFRRLGIAYATLLVLPVPALAHEQAATYRWVEPPTPEAALSGAPEGRRAELPIGRGPLAMWTPDGQARVDFPADAFAESNRIDVSIQPRAPSDPDLPTLPRAVVNGNVVEIDITDMTTAAPVDLSSVGATLTLVTPHPATRVMHADRAGAAWLPAPIVEQTEGHVVVALRSNGVWVALADHDEDGWFPRVAVGAGGLALAVVGLWRRRRAASAQGG